MKVEVLQEELIRAVGLVLRAVATRAQLPVLGHVLIEAKEQSLVLTSTDLELSMRTVCPAKVDEEGTTTVPAKMFFEYLGALPPGKIVLETKEQHLNIRAHGAKAQFQTLSPEEFPKLPSILSEHILLEPEVTALTEAIQAVSFASAKDTLRPVLTGVLLEFGTATLKLVATDGFRLAVAQIPGAVKRESGSILVPARAIGEVSRVFTEGKIALGYLPETHQVYFVQGEVLLLSQILEGNFPDYAKILPKSHTGEVVVNRDEFVQAVKTAHIFARDNSNMMRWSIAPKEILIRASSPEKGECELSLPVQLSGEGGEIVFNARYVLDYLSLLSSQEVRFTTGGKLAPGVFADPKHEESFYVVMPINA
jgi:DNA polymerase-3 subunit beta